MNKALRNPLIYILFVLPAFILFLAFFIYPIYTAIDNSFTSWNGISKDVKYIGFDNYATAMSDVAFWKSVKNNVYFILFSCLVQVPLIVIFSLLIANVKRLKGLYKTAVFAPSIMSTAVIGILWGFIYNPDFGLMNQLLGLFGVEPIYWLSDKNWAMLSILITNAWQWTGFYIVMVLAAIISIPKELDEAAAIDGATGWQRAMKITLPLVMPIISVVIMLSIAGAMKAADIILVMTKGGPAGSTDVMATYMIRYAITSFKHGFGNSIAVLIFVFTMIITALYQVLIARRNERIEY
ncbi:MULTISPECIES: carbohydrate ABC transporter permease [Paenibacillus]|uniref:Binding-protein-dependent transport systems inner membrane component n=2 Tax=Paenibacillus lactis TaxID=228574 RepID=G4HEV7_9BACL|nr:MULTISPECIES: sugar ABC transporter permease [Paenibacillus]EHB64274.1 binding-protein-dependent transport systems inner membrane component [Paenibacillus lactis 154]MBP1893111.1 raffinose/stachyose/melibiose transport system permease protein [Paenibacillus lactis]MCM3495342.1 sugar ABC transporter permease [Paenibacillus lactis]GIO91967.1 ABC transporter permease [Paenibacillus lactis]HAF97429.1 sugar ABC transporter permease [Paenibacillus lactis]